MCQVCRHSMDGSNSQLTVLLRSESAEWRDWHPFSTSITSFRSRISSSDLCRCCCYPTIIQWENETRIGSLVSIAVGNTLHFSFCSILIGKRWRRQNIGTYRILFWIVFVWITFLLTWNVTLELWTLSSSHVLIFDFEDLCTQNWYFRAEINTHLERERTERETD